MAFGEDFTLDAADSRGRRKIVPTSGWADRYTHTVPASFALRHKPKQRRTLSIPHPRAQLDAAQFYKRHADSMLYYTSLSPFSLRHPASKARYYYVRDWLFESHSDPSSGQGVESSRRESAWIKSYFTYTRYSNVFRFYDSAEYRLCERKYGYLAKVDIAKCFDSIYTHSVTWATHGKSTVKANLRTSKKTFAGRFDSVMQSMNHSETSGILIGPEFSRIFAEVILQAVDLAVLRRLTARGLKYRRDYEILRYVDDYFIFMADPAHRDTLVEVLASELRPYKLHLNAAKEEGDHTPLVSPLTVAKRRVRDLLKSTVDVGKPIPVGDAMRGTRLPASSASADRLTVGYKAILIDTGAGHDDLANYTLARLERRLETVARRAREVRTSVTTGTSHREIERFERETLRTVLALLEFGFFVYAGAPRMSPGIKLARVTTTTLRLARELDLDEVHLERVERAIRRGLTTQLARFRDADLSGMEAATLLDCLTDLGEQHTLDELQLVEVLGFTKGPRGELSPPMTLNVVSVFCALRHIGDRDGYDSFRNSVNTWLSALAQRPLEDAERALAALNLVSCPYVPDEIKSALLGAIPGRERSAAIREPRALNVEWEKFDLYEALQRKRLFEVY